MIMNAQLKTAGEEVIMTHFKFPSQHSPERI